MHLYKTICLLLTLLLLTPFVVSDRDKNEGDDALTIAVRGVETHPDGSEYNTDVSVVKSKPKLQDIKFTNK